MEEGKNIIDFLHPTELIDSDHPAIISKANEITGLKREPEDKAKAIFYFVRDYIRYIFRADLDEQKYKASSILKSGKGFCTQKAILFCALARACQIPSGIHFYDIVDYTLNETFVRFLKTRTLYHHGVPVLYLNNTWYQYDATLDIELVKNKGLRPVEFCMGQNCLMHPTTLNGEKHVEYVRDHGMYSDVTFKEIESWLKEGYPHLL